jgi:hypothetical protein
MKISLNKYSAFVYRAVCNLKMFGLHINITLNMIYIMRRHYIPEVSQILQIKRPITRMRKLAES